MKGLDDFTFRELTRLCALGVLLVLFAMAFELARASLPSLSEFGAPFVVGRVWDPVGRVFGALPFVWGTIASSLLALALALPISLGAATYLAELAPAWLRAPLGFLIELLAAVPSVVYGLWGTAVLAPWLRDSVEPGLARTFGFLPFFEGPSHGVGLLAAGITLAIMITPTISSVSREVLRAVPSELREGALALGATQFEVLRIAVLPHVRAGLFGAAMLGLGRALGETMAVTMLIGNRAQISASLFAPAYTMASVVANEFSEASDDLHLAALAEIGLLLFAVTLLLNLVARLLVSRVGRSLFGSRS
ncbi:MAG: phosphate ABC transporter permease subunit PstC [Myxococcota bacterium]